MKKIPVRFVYPVGEAFQDQYWKMVIRVRDKLRPLSKGWAYSTDLNNNGGVAMNNTIATAIASHWINAAKKLHCDQVEFASATISPFQDLAPDLIGLYTFPVLFSGTYGERATSDSNEEEPLNHVLRIQKSAPPGWLGAYIFRGCILGEDGGDGGDEYEGIDFDSPINPTSIRWTEWKDAMLGTISGGEDYSYAMIGRPTISSELKKDPLTTEDYEERVVGAPRSRQVLGYAMRGLRYKKYGGG